jgi:chorismate synthase
MYNSFGNLLRITTFGESHGKMIGVVIDGFPAGFEVDFKAIQLELDRRRPGQSPYTTPRNEADQAECVSGIFRGQTTGAPITFLIPNQDTKPEDYSEMAVVFRPSHADYTYQEKYGLRDHRGSGRASARETAGRVAAGALAGQYLEKCHGVKVMAWVRSIGAYQLPDDFLPSGRAAIDASPVRCPDLGLSEEICRYIEYLKTIGDSAGGVIECLAEPMPTGWGEPVYMKLSAALAHGLFTLPAVKGFEIGSGFRGTLMLGSEHNDLFYKGEDGSIQTRTNHSGGIQGGISNGAPLSLKVAFKPVSTIAKSQETVDQEGNTKILEGKGRHDPCVLPRAVPLVEAMTRLILADYALLNLTRRLT